MITGEDLVTEVAEATDGNFVLVNPLVMVQDFDEDTGAEFMSMHRYVMFDDENKNYEVSKQHVIIAAPASEEMHGYYLKNLEIMITENDKRNAQRIKHSSASLSHYLGKDKFDTKNVIELKGRFVHEGNDSVQ
jgi:hypothetical protein